MQLIKIIYVCKKINPINSDFDIKNNLISNLGKTTKFIGLYISDYFQEHQLNLSKAQWLVLKILQDKDGCIQNDLAIITDRSKTSLTRLIQTMEKKGLIFRKNSKMDKRTNHVFLTKKGQNLFNQSVPIFNKLKLELEHHISQEEIETTLKVLEKIRSNINAKNLYDI